MLYNPQKNIFSIILLYIIFIICIISLMLYIIITKNINSNIDRQYKSITIDVTNKLNICKDNINNDNKGIYTKNIR